MHRLVLVAAIALAAPAAHAEDYAAKLCPILEKVAANAPGAIPEMVQADLAIDVGDAYDLDPEALQGVLDNADAATTAACPDARAAVLKAAGKTTLEETMR